MFESRIAKNPVRVIMEEEFNLITVKNCDIVDFSMKYFNNCRKK